MSMNANMFVVSASFTTAWQNSKLISLLEAISFQFYIDESVALSQKPPLTSVDLLNLNWLYFILESAFT